MKLKVVNYKTNLWQRHNWSLPCQILLFRVPKSICDNNSATRNARNTHVENQLFDALRLDGSPRAGGEESSFTIRRCNPACTSATMHHSIAPAPPSCRIVISRSRLNENLHMDRLTSEFRDRNANRVYSYFLQDHALIKKKQVKR